MKFKSDNATDHSKNLKRLDYGLVSKAYAVSANVFDELLKNLEVINSSETRQGSLIPVDHIMAALHKDHHSFVVKEAVCYRSASSSMVGGGRSDNNHWQSDC